MIPIIIFDKMSISELAQRMFDSSIFCHKIWALKKWCVTKVAHCMCSKPDRVDVKSGNVPRSQNKIKGQLGANEHENRQTLLSMPSSGHMIPIKFIETI